jgi:hypothetical protein
MADNDVKVTLDLDNEEFVSKLKESLGLLGDLGNTDGIDGLVDSLTKIGEVAGVVTVGFLAFKAAIDLTETAEHIKQVSANFDNLTSNLDIATDKIKEDLLAATKGLADETSVLQAGSKAVLELGNNTEHLADIMTLARKYTSAFGGDLITNFENLSRAMATGNERMLKQYGIIVDTDAVTKEYAKSLGVGVEYLSDAGKKQAIFNAALQEATEKYGALKENTDNTTTSIQKIGTAFKELGAVGAKVWDNLFGDAIRAVVAEIADRIGQIATHAQVALGGETDRKKILEDQRNTLQDQLKAYDQISAKIGAANADDIELLQNKLKGVNAQLDAMNKEEEKNAAIKKEAAAANKDPGQTGTGASAVNTDKLLQDRLKYKAEIDKLDQQAQADAIKNATTIAQVDAANADRIVAMTATAENQKEKLKKDALDKGLIDDKQFAQASKLIDDDLSNKLKLNAQQVEQERIKALENAAKQSKTVSEGFSTGWAVSSAKATQALHTFSNLGQTAFKSLNKNAVSAFEALGDGSKTAAEAMRGFILGSIADMAQSQGEFLLASGIGTADPVQIAEGGALIALASLLRSQANGSSKLSGGSDTSGGSGGSTDSTSSTDTSAASASPTPAVAHQKVVSINIAGSYFDTEQTAQRLTDIVRQSADATDFDLRKIGQT